jgi:hypothetical protein
MRPLVVVRVTSADAAADATADATAAASCRRRTADVIVIDAAHTPKPERKRARDDTARHDDPECIVQAAALRAHEVGRAPRRSDATALALCRRLVNESRRMKP